MNMKKTVIVAGAVLLIVLVGAAAIMMNNPASQPSAPNSTPGNGAHTTTITYADNRFEPSTITVKSGDTVVIKNASSTTVQFDSDPHPVHTNNPELNVEEVEAGQSKTFTVNKKGTFSYHNHLAPSEKGTIIVE